MSLTTRIATLVMLALVPALAIQGYNEYALRAARGDAVRTDAMRAARGAVDDLRQFGESARQVLSILAEQPAIKDKDGRACTAYLKAVVDKIPGAFFFAVAQTDGSVVCNSTGSDAGAYTLADRGYFQEAMRTGTFAVGGYVAGKVTNRPTMQFAQPIFGPDGRPAGIIAASIDLDWLAARLARSGLPTDSTLTIADRDGMVLIRLPDQAAWVGRPLPPPFWDKLRSNIDKVVEMPGLRGTMRVTGIAESSAVGLDGLTVAVGLARDPAFADIDAATTRGVVLILLGALLALAAAILGGRVFIRRPVRRLLDASAAWRAGDLSARTGLAGRSELGQLGHAFDGMAAALQQHEGELRAEISRSHALQEQQTTMLHELNHRVRNTLATVQSLARQSRRGDEKGERLEGRIVSLSKTHDLLTRDDWAGASFREVLENELAPYRHHEDQVSMLGPDLELPPRYVLALGMMVHELTTNAAKYGAFSTTEGRVHVTWRVLTGESGMRRLLVEWRESGGPPVEAPKQHGFGTRLITKGLGRELEGEVHLDFAHQGLRCTVDMPLEGRDRFRSFRSVLGALQKQAS